MLGTNDAKDPGDGGPNNWLHDCGSFVRSFVRPSIRAFVTTSTHGVVRRQASWSFVVRVASVRLAPPCHCSHHQPSARRHRIQLSGGPNHTTTEGCSYAADYNSLLAVVKGLGTDPNGPEMCVAWRGVAWRGVAWRGVACILPVFSAFCSWLPCLHTYIHSPA